MSVKYIPNGNVKVVINKETYQNIGDKIAVLPVDKLSKEELQSLIERRFIKKLELDESGAPKSSKPKKPNSKPEGGDSLEKMSDEELLSKALEMGIQADNTMKAEELRQKIKEAQKE